MRIITSIVLLFSSSSAFADTVYSTVCPENNIISTMTVRTATDQPAVHAELRFQASTEEANAIPYLWLVVVNDDTKKCSAFDIGDATYAIFVKSTQKNSIQFLYKSNVYSYDFSEIAHGRAQRTIARL